MKNDRSPMLGARTPNYGWASYSSRGDAKERGWTTYERRIARRNEQILLASDLAAEKFSPLPVDDIGYVDEIDEIAAMPENVADELFFSSSESPAYDPLEDPDLPGWGTAVQWSDLHHFTFPAP